MVQGINKINFLFFQACMNIIQIFENKCVDSPTVDTRLPPKWARITQKWHTLRLDLTWVIGQCNWMWQLLGTRHLSTLNPIALGFRSSCRCPKTNPVRFRCFYLMVELTTHYQPMINIQPIGAAISNQSLQCDFFSFSRLGLIRWARK